jgi:hypothetical protein
MVRQRQFQHLSGWAGDLAAYIDVLDPGFYGYLVRRPIALKQVTFACMATKVRLKQLGDETEIEYPPDAELRALSETIRTQSPRKLLMEVFGSCRDGFAGAMNKIGHAAQPPGFYLKLHTILSDPGRRQIGNVIRQLRHLDAETLDVIEALDPLFLVPRFIDKVCSIQDARDLTQALALIKQHCRRATDEALDESIRHSDGPLSKWIEKWIMAADRLPKPPLDPGPDFVLLDTGPKMVEAGIRYRNCLNSLDKVVRALRGKAFYWEHPQHKVIVEAKAIGPEPVWAYTRIHVFDNGSAPVRIGKEIEQQFLRAGFTSLEWEPEETPWGAVDRLAQRLFSLDDSDELMNAFKSLTGEAA